MLLFSKPLTDHSLRKLDDDDLDSGDDEGRTDRVPQETIEEEADERTISCMDAEIARHPVPEPSDGELYSLKVPRFMTIEPKRWDPKTFEPPTTYHHSKEAPSGHFSPFETALTTIRWRRSPSNPANLQSNARILRWSDGSVTLQLASRSLEQYQIDAIPLAPPQIQPPKPTPTSLTSNYTNRVYKEGFTYLLAPYPDAQIMRVTNKFTASLSVLPTSSSNDEAIEALQSALAKAARSQLDNKDQAISFIKVDEDPEITRAKKEAEFKLRQKQLRAKEKNELKERERQVRRMGGGRSTGLHIGALEDDEGGRRGGARKPRAKTGLRRDWSDDEDYGFRKNTREDEYDEEDDFIAASDEEPEVVEDDEDDDDGIEASPPRRRQETQSPKRSRGGDDEDVVVSRPKRRRVVEDDDESE